MKMVDLSIVFVCLPGRVIPVLCIWIQGTGDSSSLKHGKIPHVQRHKHRQPSWNNIYIHLYPSISIYIHLYPSISIYIHLYPSISIYIHLYPWYISIYVLIIHHPQKPPSLHSCCTRVMLQCSGTGNFRAARCFSSVVLPMPLGPRRP